MSALARAITLFSRCWATSPLATTLKRTPSSGPGNFWSKCSNCRWSASGSPSTPTMTRPNASGSRPARRRRGYAALAKRTTGGQWVTPAPVAPARRSTSTGAISTSKGPTGLTKMTSIWRSGISSSCNMTARRMGPWYPCPPPALILVPG